MKLTNMLTFEEGLTSDNFDELIQHLIGGGSVQFDCGLDNFITDWYEGEYPALVYGQTNLWYEENLVEYSDHVDMWTNRIADYMEQFYQEDLVGRRFICRLSSPDKPQMVCLYPKEMLSQYDNNAEAAKTLLDSNY